MAADAVLPNPGSLCHHSSLLLPLGSSCWQGLSRGPSAHSHKALSPLPSNPCSNVTSTGMAALHSIGPSLHLECPHLPSLSCACPTALITGKRDDSLLVMGTSYHVSLPLPPGGRPWEAGNPVCCAHRVPAGRTTLAHSGTQRRGSSSVKRPESAQIHSLPGLAVSFVSLGWALEAHQH